jgi:hypothetical protein
MRRLFNAVTVLSLLLCLAVLLLWVRSRSITDEITGKLGSSGLWIGTSYTHDWGQLRCSVWTPSLYSEWQLSHRPTIRPGPRRALVDAAPGWAFLGFHYSAGRTKIPPNETLHSVGLPFWFIAALLAVPTVVYLRKRRMQRERSGGYCANCGYDLRVRTDRCPECGTATPAQAKV